MIKMNILESFREFKDNYVGVVKDLFKIRG